MLAITKNLVDLVFIALVVVGLVVFVGSQFYKDWHNEKLRRNAMRRAIEDYSYSSVLVRYMDQRH